MPDPKKNGAGMKGIPDDNPLMSAPDKRKLRERLKASSEQAPSSRQQSAAWVSWKQVSSILGQPFDSTRIPLSKLHQMRRDPMIAFGEQFVKVPLVRAPWFIKCEDAQVAAFVDNALRNIYARFVFQYCLSLDYGFCAMTKRFQHEKPDWMYYDAEAKEDKKVWDSESVPCITWKPFVALPPESVEPRWSSNGEFAGIRYDAPKNIVGSFTDTDDDGTQYVDILHALWATNEKDSVWGSVWGYPRIGYAYRYWWSYWYNWALADRFFEKHADPPPIVHYPDDDEETLDTAGNVVNYREIALDIAASIRSGTEIAMPSTPVMGFDEKPLSMRQWELEYLQQPNNFQAFNDRFTYLDTMKLRSLMIPEQAFEAKGGSAGYNSTSQLQQAFQESQAVLMAEIDEVINKYMIPQLVAINFPDRQVTAKKITRGFATEDIEFAKQIIQLVGQTDPSALQVDVREVLEQLGIPLKSPAEIQKEMIELQQQIAASTPPEMQPQAGQAGVLPVTGLPTAVGDAAPNPNGAMATAGSATGFAYVSPPERIELAERHDDDTKEILTRLELSVDYVDIIPGTTPEALAYLDRERKKIYVRKGTTIPDERRYVKFCEMTLAG